MWAVPCHDLDYLTEKAKASSTTLSNEFTPLFMSSRAKALKEPFSKRELNTREKIILLEGSKLHGSVFLPWTTAPEPAEFELLTGEAQYVDNVDLPLSAAQAEVFDSWRRPNEVQQARNRNDDTSDRNPRTLDLVQDIITDCSVVASLGAITARIDRGIVDVLGSSVFPYDHTSRKPATSKNGKYIFRFHFNGCYRKVVIDDRLPSSETARALHVVDRNNAGVYWPALVEKAYLKVRGGYDFPGSNSGTDLWVLTGWIPEQLFLQSDDMDRHMLWRRVLNAFGYGDVLITIGTGKLTESEERGLGLVGEHDYSVIDVKEDKGQQLFLVKNPWSNGQVWKGQIRYQSLATSIDENGVPLDRQEVAVSDPPNVGRLAPGSFWMPFNDVFQSFDSIYLNWNPGLFSHREDVHLRWNLLEPSSADGCLASNPQYGVRSQAAGVLWLLLSRHFTNSKEKKIAENDPGFISLYAFHNNGQRAVMRDGAFAHSPYVDSPNALLKINLASEEAFTVVVSEQNLPRKVHSFSLSVLSFAPIELAPVGEKYAYNTVLHGSWTAATSGGNAGSPLYHTNPQFSIELAQSSDISLLLRTTDGWPVQVNMVWTNGKQVRSITTRDIVGDSGEYQKGVAFAEIRDVPVGIYTIVCSTFERGQKGDFKLIVGSTTACQLDRVAAATSGRFVTELEDAIWNPENNRLLAPLATRRLNRISVSAKSCGFPGAAGQQYCSPLKVSIEHGRGPTTQTVALSGEGNFEDARHVGVHTADVDILPEMCGWGLWIALDRLGSSGLPHNERVKIQILSDGPVEVGAWMVGD